MESPCYWTGWQGRGHQLDIVSNMGSRAVQYRAPQYDVDASQQTYLVQKL